MKRTLLLFVLLISGLFSFAQVVENPYVGSYKLRPNDKVSYPFTSAVIEPNRLTLSDNGTIVQVFSITGYDELKGFRLTQIYPEVPSELKERANMNAKTALVEGDVLHVLIEGNGNHGEFYFEPVK